MHWLVLDLETTGLVPGLDHILECAVVALDPEELLPTVMAEWLVPHRLPLPMSEYVREMHTKNRLLTDIESDRGLPPHEAYERLASDLHGFLDAVFGQGSKGIHLVGNSVHFDFNFLRAHVPAVAARFSHRIVDVSSLILCHNQWAPGRLEKAEPAHRAMADCIESIETLRKIKAQAWHRH